MKLAKKYVARKFLVGTSEEKQPNILTPEKVEEIMAMPLSKMPLPIREHCQAMICRRYNLPVRECLFRHPTIGQWVADITGKYTAEDIMAFFAQETALSSEFLKTATIGGQTLTRPYLITLVEKLEDATGRQLTLPESTAPLSYLGDDVTFYEIAKYFACSSETVTRLRRRYCRQHSQVRDEVLKLYRVYAEIDSEVSDEELLTRKVQDCYLKEYGSNSWDLPVFWVEERLDIHINIHQVKPETTVADLVAIFDKSPVGAGRRGKK